MQEALQHKQDMVKHVERVHRKQRRERHVQVAFIKPMTLPVGLDPFDVLVTCLFYKTVPAGYNRKDLPLVGVKIGWKVSGSSESL
jgi:hypothetical protein